jgi:hypothetical protein
MNITCHFDNFRNKGEERRRLNVFENMALRKIFGFKMEEINVIFRRLHNLYLLLCITALGESSRMKYMVHILKMLFAYKISLGNIL